MSLWMKELSLKVSLKNIYVALFSPEISDPIQGRKKSEANPSEGTRPEDRPTGGCSTSDIKANMREL